MPRKKGPEAEIQATIRKMLDAAGITHFRMNSGMLRNARGRLVKFGEKGMGDLLAFVRMRVACKVDLPIEIDADSPPAPAFVPVMMSVPVWIEVKAPGKKTTPDQDKFADKMRKCGHVYMVADNIENFTRVLNFWREMGQ